MAKYNTNFLDKVVLRLDFGDISLANIEKYQGKINNVFDINSNQNGFEGSFNIDVVEGVMSQSKSELSVWEMRSTAQPDKKITFSQKWISIEYENRSYVNSEVLLNDIDAYIQSFLEDFEVKIINRVGLRYINQLTPPGIENPLDWSEYISDDLVGSLDFARAQGLPLARSFTQQFYKDEKADLVFSYGLWNDDFPNIISSKAFILDFDCASSVPREVSDLALKVEIRDYNKLVEKMFEASIKQPLRDVMGIES